jgi:hypothetical protein
MSPMIASPPARGCSLIVSAKIKVFGSSIDAHDCGAMRWRCPTCMRAVMKVQRLRMSC